MRCDERRRAADAADDGGQARARLVPSRVSLRVLTLTLAGSCGLSLRRQSHLQELSVRTMRRDSTDAAETVQLCCALASAPTVLIARAGEQLLFVSPSRLADLVTDKNSIKACRQALACLADPSRSSSNVRRSRSRILTSQTSTSASSATPTTQTRPRRTMRWSRRPDVQRVAESLTRLTPSFRSPSHVQSSFASVRGACVSV